MAKKLKEPVIVSQLPELAVVVSVPTNDTESYLVYCCEDGKVNKCLDGDYTYNQAVNVAYDCADAMNDKQDYFTISYIHFYNADNDTFVLDSGL